MTTTLESLTFRQQQVSRMNALTLSYQLPLIKFTTFVPRDYQFKQLQAEVFGTGIKEIKQCLASQDLRIRTRQIVHTRSFSEALLVIESQDPLALKKAMMNIENNHMFGALFNIDVFDATGMSVSRKGCEMQARRCLICQDNLARCLSRSSHTKEAYFEALETRFGGYC